jgi:ATP-binding protein involved in chromosome partitioning
LELEIFKSVSLLLLGQIPLNKDIYEGSDNGEPPVVLGSDELESYYREIVENMLKAVKFKVWFFITLN